MQALEEPFGSRDATACAATCHKVEDSIPDSVLHIIAFFSESRKRLATFAYRDSFLEDGDTLLWILRADGEAILKHMHIEAVKETFRASCLLDAPTMQDTLQFT